MMAFRELHDESKPLPTHRNKLLGNIWHLGIKVIWKLGSFREYEFSHMTHISPNAVVRIFQLSS